MTEREAVAAARRSFGSEAALADDCRDQRQTAWLEDFLRDIRYAFRSFFRNPSATTVAVATLAVCIGLNAGFLATAYSIAFSPLPYPSPDHLIALQDIGGLGPVTQSCVRSPKPALSMRVTRPITQLRSRRVRTRYG